MAMTLGEGGCPGHGCWSHLGSVDTDRRSTAGYVFSEHPVIRSSAGSIRVSDHTYWRPLAGSWESPEGWGRRRTRTRPQLLDVDQTGIRRYAIT